MLTLKLIVLSLLHLLLMYFEYKGHFIDLILFVLIYACYVSLFKNKQVL